MKKSELRKIIKEEIYNIISEIKIKNYDDLLDLTKKYMNKNYKKKVRNHLADIEKMAIELFNDSDIKTDKDLYGFIDYYAEDDGGIGITDK